MKPAYIGIDIGTSGVRACCIDENAQILATEALALPLPDIRDGHSQQNPDIWWQTTQKVIQTLTSKTTDINIQAISVDGTSGTVLATDYSGTPLADALMYNDQSCTKEASDIAHLAPKNSAVHSSTSGLAKALHLIKLNPDTKHICHQADWISSQFSKAFGISDENNCLKTGYDAENRCWPNYLQDLKISPDLLPKVVTPGSKIGVIDKTIASSLGLSEHCFIVSGTTDSIAAYIAATHNQLKNQSETPGIGVTSLGSTLSLKMLSATPVFSAKDGIYSHRLGDAWLIGGASNTGGRVLQQFFSQQEIEKFSKQLNTEVLTGMDYYPLTKKGERFPINDTELKPKLTPRPDDDQLFFQAILEGITSIEKAGYEKLVALSRTKLNHIISAGGGSQNKQWTKIREKMLNVDITTAEQTEASFGSAILAMQGHKTA